MNSNKDPINCISLLFMITYTNVRDPKNIFESSFGGMNPWFKLHHWYQWGGSGVGGGFSGVHGGRQSRRLTRRRKTFTFWFSFKCSILLKSLLVHTTKRGLKYVFWVPNIGVCDHKEEWDTVHRVFIIVNSLYCIFSFLKKWFIGTQRSGFKIKIVKLPRP